MFLRDLKSSLLRRWYFVIAGLLLTGGLSVAATELISPTYEVQASVVLLPPPTTVTANGNPYMFLGGLNQALDVLTHSLNSDESQQPILATHPNSSFTAAPDPSTSGPIVLITVDGRTADSTMSALKAVMNVIPAKLLDLQNQLSVAKESRITVMTLSQDEKPKAITKARTRALLAVVAVGLAGTVLVCGLLDGLILRRQRRRLPGDSSDDVAETETAAARSFGSSKDNESLRLQKRTSSAKPEALASHNGSTQTRQTPSPRRSLL